MKSEGRLLPQLNQLYLQKRSYQIHRKKVDSINKSQSIYSKKILDRQHNIIDQNQESPSRKLSYRELINYDTSPFTQQKSSHLLKSIEKSMQAIQETKGISYWMKKMTPLQKRLKQQQMKENKRLRQKIKNSVSFITNKKQLQIHQQKFENIKRRLSKFQFDQNQLNTNLKSQIALKKISDIGRQRLKMQQSRLNQISNNRLQQSKSQIFAKKRALSQKLGKSPSTRSVNLMGKMGHSQNNIGAKSSREVLPMMRYIKQMGKGAWIKSAGKQQLKQTPAAKINNNRISINQSKLSKLSSSSMIQPLKPSNRIFKMPTKPRLGLKSGPAVRMIQTCKNQTKNVRGILSRSQTSQRSFSMIEQKSVKNVNQRYEHQRRRIEQYYGQNKSQQRIKIDHKVKGKTDSFISKSSEIPKVNSVIRIEQEKVNCFATQLDQ